MAAARGVAVQHVSLPGYLQSRDEGTKKLVETLAQRARLHGLQPDVQHVEGNPIVEWLRVIGADDIAVIARRPTTRDSFSQPDLALRVTQKALGSVLVVTVSA